MSALRAASKPISILSLDGGGCRGIISIVILRALFIAIRRYSADGQEDGIGGEEDRSALMVPDDDILSLHEGWEEPLHVADVFDLVAGTSTGGLITMLGARLNQPLQVLYTEYHKIAPKIFGKEARKIGNPLFGEKFSATKFRVAVKEVLDRLAPEEEQILTPNNPISILPSCRQALAVRVGRLGPDEPLLQVFTSKARPGRDDYDVDVPIIDVCRATTSAVTYFKPQCVNGKLYSDAGVGYNNPTMIAIVQAARYFQSPEYSLRAVVSIGTGYKVVEKKRARKVYIRNILKGLEKQILNTTQAHNDANEHFQNKQNGPSHYFRFDPPISGYKLDDHEKMTEMVNEVVTWLKQQDIRDKITQAAKLLSGTNTALLDGWATF